MAERLSDTDIDMVELNISCPNVKEGGVQFGTSCRIWLSYYKGCPQILQKPLIVKAFTEGF